MHARQEEGRISGGAEHDTHGEHGHHEPRARLAPRQVDRDTAAREQRRGELDTAERERERDGHRERRLHEMLPRDVHARRADCLAHADLARAPRRLRGREVHEVQHGDAERQEAERKEHRAHRDRRRALPEHDRLEEIDQGLRHGPRLEASGHEIFRHVALAEALETRLHALERHRSVSRKQHERERTEPHPRVRARRQRLEPLEVLPRHEQLEAVPQERVRELRRAGNLPDHARDREVDVSDRERAAEHVDGSEQLARGVLRDHGAARRERGLRVARDQGKLEHVEELGVGAVDASERLLAVDGRHCVGAVHANDRFELRKVDRDVFRERG